jgi:Arc/MetJ-type ribon-helix-helix transcriptional regulator
MYTSVEVEGILMKGATVTVCTRVDKPLAQAMHEVTKKHFLNEADFIRAAIRDMIFKYETAKIRSELAKTKDSVKAVKKFRKLTSEMFTEEEFDKLVEENTKDMP